jgi:hypothetical protein
MLVEFALLFPILLALMLAVVEFGIYFFIQHTMQFAAREGARLASVGAMARQPGPGDATREETILMRVRECAAVAVDPDRCVISVYPLTVEGSDPTGWEGRMDAGEAGAMMRLRVSTPVRFIDPIMRLVLEDGTLDAQAQATYRNEFF